MKILKWSQEETCEKDEEFVKWRKSSQEMKKKLRKPRKLKNYQDIEERLKILEEKFLWREENAKW